MDVGERKTVSCKVNPQAPSGSPTSSLILSPFEGFDGDVSFRPFPHANLTGCRSRTTETTKMELFEQVTLGLVVLKKKKKTIVLVAEARARIQANV